MDYGQWAEDLVTIDQCSLVEECSNPLLYKYFVGQIVGQKLRTKNKLTSLAIKKLKAPRSVLEPEVYRT